MNSSVILFCVTYYITDSGVSRDDCETGEIRLIGGASQNEGRLEICVNRLWGTVCGLNWDEKDTAVVCGDLGYQIQGKEIMNYIIIFIT